VLQLPDLTKLFFLWVNASNAEEASNGKTVLVAFANRPASAAEQKFDATELEVAGLVFACTRTLSCAQ